MCNRVFQNVNKVDDISTNEFDFYYFNDLTETVNKAAWPVFVELKLSKYQPYTIKSVILIHSIAGTWYTCQRIQIAMQWSQR